MQRFATVADRDAVEAEKPWEARKRPATLYGFLSEVAKTHGSRPALSFQILSGPTDKAETLS